MESLAITSLVLFAATASALIIKWRSFDALQKNLSSSLESLREKNINLEKALAIATSEITHLEKSLESQAQQFSKLEENAKSQFQNVANEVFEKSTANLEQNSLKAINALLFPLRERIVEFEKKVHDTYEKEARERFSLQKELLKMIDANKQLTSDAQNLAAALKNDSKTQGNWGEIQLEMILERSGLREDQEYIREGKNLKLKGDEGNHLKPDVIVKLPEDKCIIIDSKVSLKSYEKLVSSSNEEDKELRAKALNEFADSINRHVSNLASKKYHDIDGLNSPEFVLMFMPIEPAFALAMHNRPELFTQAWEKRIIIVSPTNLLATLKTVASIWKSEYQNKHALEIAQKAGSLHDKFVGFLSDIEKVGKALSGAQTDYENAIKKLSHGKGNLISATDKLRIMGARASKKISHIKSFKESIESIEAE